MDASKPVANNSRNDENVKQLAIHKLTNGLNKFFVVFRKST